MQHLFEETLFYIKNDSMLPVVVNFFTDMMIISKKKAGTKSFINWLAFDKNSHVSDI